MRIHPQQGRVCQERASCSDSHKGATDLAVSLPVWLADAQSQWKVPSQQWSLLVRQAWPVPVGPGLNGKHLDLCSGLGNPLGVGWHPPPLSLWLVLRVSSNALHCLPRLVTCRSSSAQDSPLCTSPFLKTGRGWGLNAGVNVLQERTTHHQALQILEVTEQGANRAKPAGRRVLTGGLE